jgi:hypothetical protein
VHIIDPSTNKAVASFMVSIGHGAAAAPTAAGSTSATKLTAR